MYDGDLNTAALFGGAVAPNYTLFDLVHNKAIRLIMILTSPDTGTIITSPS